MKNDHARGSDRLAVDETMERRIADVVEAQGQGVALGRRDHAVAAAQSLIDVRRIFHDQGQGERPIEKLQLLVDVVGDARGRRGERRPDLDRQFGHGCHDRIVSVRASMTTSH